MTPRRIVVCWLSSERLNRSAAEQRALLSMAGWCADRRLYPGPGAVAFLANYNDLHPAAAQLGVAVGVLGDAVFGLVRLMPRAVDVWTRPVAAVATQVRSLDISGTTSAREWSAAA